jgi:hypothetical protein
LYIYSGEDVPRESQEEKEPIDIAPLIIAIQDAKTMDELKVAYIKAIKAVNGDLELQVILESSKNTRKAMIANEEKANKDALQQEHEDNKS